MSTKEYLGDSVYAEFDGEGIRLTTDNGYGPTNTIYIDGEVYASLVMFVERIRNESAPPQGPENEEAP
jgi:hypothetical protein